MMDVGPRGHVAHVILKSQGLHRCTGVSELHACVAAAFKFPPLLPLTPAPPARVEKAPLESYSQRPSFPIPPHAQVEKAPLESYADVGGLEPQIQEIKEAVELPLTHPELYEDIGIKPPKVWRRGGRHQGRRATGGAFRPPDAPACAHVLRHAANGGHERGLTLINSLSSANKQRVVWCRYPAMCKACSCTPRAPRVHGMILYCPMCRV